MGLLPNIYLYLYQINMSHNTSIGLFEALYTCIRQNDNFCGRKSECMMTNTLPVQCYLL